MSRDGPERAKLEGTDSKASVNEGLCAASLGRDTTGGKQMWYPGRRAFGSQIVRGVRVQLLQKTRTKEQRSVWQRAWGAG